MTAVNAGAAYVELSVKYDNTIKKVAEDIAGLDRTAATVSGRVTDHFTRGFRNVHDESKRTADGVGLAFSDGMTKGIREAFQGVTTHLGNFSGVANTAISGITSTAGLAAIGIAGIGAAAIVTGKQLYDLGADWVHISDNITARTGLVGVELDKVKDSVKRVGSEAAVSLEEIGNVAAQLTSTLHLTGEPLDKLTQQIVVLHEKTGDSVNIRELAKVFKGFNTDAADMSTQFDSLYDAFTRTQIPVSEMVDTLRVAGPVARTLGLDMGQTASLLVSFNDAGISSNNALVALRQGMANLSKEKPPKGVLGDFLKDEDGKDITTKIQDLITEIQKTGNIDLARQAFGARSFAPLFDAIREGKITAEDFNKALENTGHTIEKTKEATDHWNEKLKESWNTLKSDLEPTATTVFTAISKQIENLITLLDSFTTKTAGIKVPGVPQNAQLPGVNFPTDQYGNPPGINPPGPTGLPSPGSQGQGYTPGGPLTPGQQQSQRRGVPTPGMIQWQVYDPATGKWSIQEVPKPAPIEPPKPPGPDTTLPPPVSELDTSGGAGSKSLPKAPALPFNTSLPPGFLQLPQTTELLGAESGFIDARHDVEEKRARVDQLATDVNATENDIQGARNDLLQAQIRQQQAELRMYDTRQGMFDKEAKRVEAENKRIEAETKKYESQFSGGSLIDFLLYLIFQPGIDAIRQKIHAPEIAAAQAASAAASASEGFGAGSQESFGLGGSSLFSGTDLTTPSGIAAGGQRTAALYSLAQSLQGTPYSKDLRNDCSGMVSQLAAAAVGLPIPSAGERFTTVNEGERLAQMGFQPGIGPPGTFRIGWNPLPGNAGHTAATLPGGQNVEQGGGNQPNAFTIGGTAQGYNAPQFTQHAYLPMQSPYARQQLTPQQLVNPALTPMPPGFQDGGQVPGWGGGDQWPILTEGGEFVMPKDQAQQNMPALQAMQAGGDPNRILDALAQGGAGAPHLPPGGPVPIGPTGQQQASPKTGRTGGYTPSGAGASGQAGTSLFSGAIGMGADVINYFIDTGASLVSEAASAALAAGTMGGSAAAGPAAGAAAGFGIQAGADIMKRYVSYGAQVLGILGDSAMEIMSPFGVPRLWQTDPKQFMPQIGALPAAITTAEKAMSGDQSAGGPVQPGQLPGAQPVGPSAKKAEAGGIVPSPAPAIQGMIDSLTPKFPGAQQPLHQGTGARPGPMPPSAQAGAATAAHTASRYDPSSAGTHNDYSVNVGTVTVKNVDEMQSKLADKQKLQMMRYAGRPS